ncbi:type 1 glutamine amidotransferase [Xanthobacter dioxanivorans]|uniref:Type 1 glutamine amidotransferase n=1 Tax=Xanthobacter dioxanivorans TaxID=2528964 RepID=A0A974SHB7_9HYPH|nr:type 1 glutamine amidotransferase [Xanthobacter dioxanivorans]QRG05212.1 type 1 glutamine amidotransferase [Xanthobacter dioxanivorans]
MRVLVFQHVAAEHPGSLRDLMRADGVVWDPVELDEGEAIPPLDGYDALMVFGGPMDVWQEEEHPWLVPEKAAIRDWVSAGRPFLGVCLGHQLLAEALGGKVGLMSAPEVGVTDVTLTKAGQSSPLFQGFAPTFPTLQWHGAAVRTLPPGGVILAENAHCPIQALQVGPRAFGIQYHVELTETTVPEWGAITEYRCALEAIVGDGGQAVLEAATREKMPVFRDAAAKLYRNFRATWG